MSKLNKTAFIVEGPSEAKLLNRMIKSLPDKTILDVMLILPAEMNMYMLWNDVKNEPDIDIISYLKEKSESIRDVLGEMNSDDFSEIYMFFDLDAQQDNIKYNNRDELIDIIKSMLKTFNNETDKGKLYISYLMCEAYSDYIEGSCKTYTEHCYQNPFDKGYKNRVGNNNKNAILTHLNAEKINEIINCYLDRLACIYDADDKFDYVNAKKISTVDIFDRQASLLKQELIIVLSAFPEFITDFYKIDVLRQMFPAIDMHYNQKCENKMKNKLFEEK